MMMSAVDALESGVKGLWLFLLPHGEQVGREKERERGATAGPATGQREGQIIANLVTKGAES